jgi:cellulose synthase/poly-beta-1,6-N-acetylglucosamine synthase-like glycosyltransferase
MGNTLDIIIVCILRIFVLLYLYQTLYLLVGLFCKPKRFVAENFHRYAVLISARNERAVIANLIESIKNQDYASELVDIFVVADNCTDDTAVVARQAGAIVFERYDEQQKGKGYALNYLLGMIKQQYGPDYYEGYFVFDADNILEKDYISQMNTVFDNGYSLVTSYRNSKNYSDNWITSGYGLWFLREARYLNNARMILGASCVVSGTGFLVHKDIIKRNGGWNCFLLTEDIQFSTENIIRGDKIGYCADAMFYDEQPVRFIDSWNQRLRWSKGFYQVFFRYGRDLIKKIFIEFKFSCYDMFMTLLPGLLVTVLIILACLGVVVAEDTSSKILMDSLTSLALYSVVASYVSFFVMGLITTLTEWKNIYCNTQKKVFYLFTFPIFMFTYLPISIVALFAKIHWKPIPHSVAVTANQIKGQ